MAAANILVFFIGLLFLEMGRKADNSFNGIPRKRRTPSWYQEIGPILCDVNSDQNLGRWLRGFSLAVCGIAILRLSGLLQ